jgi:hypothetical protein
MRPTGPNIRIASRLSHTALDPLSAPARAAGQVRCDRLAGRSTIGVDEIRNGNLTGSLFHSHRSHQGRRANFCHRTRIRTTHDRYPLNRGHREMGQPPGAP